MSLSNFSVMLEQWEKRADEEKSKVKREISYFANDEIKLKALADVYQLPFDEVVANLLHQALLAVEEKMPYVQGKKVIRVEEGTNVYEDIGPMADYLKVLEKYRNATA